MKKVFLDTNILIDFFEETRYNNLQAKQLIYFLLSIVIFFEFKNRIEGESY